MTLAETQSLTGKHCWQPVKIPAPKHMRLHWKEKQKSSSHKEFSGLMPAHTDINEGAGCCGNWQILTTTGSRWSSHWEPGWGRSWQLVGGTGRSLGLRGREHMPSALLPQGYGTPEALRHLCSYCNRDRNPERITYSSHMPSFLVVVVVVLPVEVKHSTLHYWLQKPNGKWPCVLQFLLLLVLTLERLGSLKWVSSINLIGIAVE